MSSRTIRVVIISCVTAFAALLAIQHYCIDVLRPGESINFSAPIPETYGMTFQDQFSPTGYQFVFNSDGHGMVCGLDAKGNEFLGNGHTWQECSKKLMEEILSEYPKNKPQETSPRSF